MKNIFQGEGKLEKDEQENEESLLFVLGSESSSMYVPENQELAFEVGKVIQNVIGITEYNADNYKMWNIEMNSGMSFMSTSKIPKK